MSGFPEYLDFTRAEYLGRAWIWICLPNGKDTELVNMRETGNPGCEFMSSKDNYNSPTAFFEQNLQGCLGIVRYMIRYSNPRTYNNGSLANMKEKMSSISWARLNGTISSENSRSNPASLPHFFSPCVVSIYSIYSVYTNQPKTHIFPYLQNQSSLPSMTFYLVLQSAVLVTCTIVFWCSPSPRSLERH